MTAQSAHDQTRPSEPPGSAHSDRMGVTGTQVAASVLASVSAAVIASMFGVAGTIVGAAVVSVIATVGSAAYGLGIRRTKARLYKLQGLRLTRPTGDAAPGQNGADLDDRDDRAAREPAATETVGVEPDPAAGAATGPDGTTAVSPPRADTGWRAWLSQRRWSVAAGVAIVFVVSLACVTLIELVGDQPLSGESDRRTSVGALLPSGGGADTDSPDAPVTTTLPGSPTTTASEPDGDQPTTTVDRSGTTTTTSPAPTTTSTTAPPPTSTTSPPVTVPGATTTVPPAEPAPSAG